MLTIFIPAYEEAENLAVLLPRLVSTVSAIEANYEILVVDTVKPKDNTKEVCEAITGNVRYVNCHDFDSYGQAVRTGINLAQGKYLITLDADGSHEPEFIPKLYRERDSYDVVIASRYTQGGGTENSKILIFMSWVLNLTYSTVLGLNCKDVSNSFKLYKTEELKRLTLRSNNFDIIQEILVKLKRIKKDLKIKEIPFTFKSRMYGETKRNLPVFMLTYIFTLIKLKFGK